jgi:hypothetical protein
VHILENPAPCQWHQYIKNQTNTPFVDGCYTAANPSAAVGPPVQLLHPAFGHLLDDIADETLSVPEPILASTFQFMQEACRASDRNWDDLNQALSKCLGSRISCCAHGCIWPDGTIQQSAGITMLIESTTAFGNGSDPAIQVSFSMANAQVRVVVILDPIPARLTV